MPDSNFVLVQAGTFTMGSPTAEPGRFDDETQHEVSLTKSYYVSKYEVTQAEWEAVMHWNDSSFLGPNKPIDRISWYDCISYCNKRSGAEGLDSVYVMRLRYYEGHNITVATPVTCDWAKNGYRLPTDAEWENACRAGSVTAFCNGPILNATFPCGRDRNLDLVGWYCANSSGATHEVGGKAANAWGLFDMHGNIWEYCWDWWCGDCNDAPATDPHGAATGTYRVCRGGNWVSGPFECRSALRSGKVPGEHDGTNMRGGYGLRVVRNPQ